MRAATILTMSWALLACAGLMQACDGGAESENTHRPTGSRDCVPRLQWEGRAYVWRPMQPNAVRASGRLSDGVYRDCPRELGSDSRRQPAQVLRIKSVRPAIAVLVNGKPGIFVRPGFHCTGGSRDSSWRPLVCRPRGSA
jgi:hypothetical protein